MNSEAAERKVSDEARAAALVVIDNLSDRRGLSFDGIDAETMAEIADAIAEIAQAHFDAARAEDAERIGELEREVKHDERAHGDTIDDRDRYSDCLQEIDVALGGTGEWSNHYDTAGEAVERSKQVAAARAKDAERIAELESEKEAAWAEVESFAAETDKARAEIARLTEVARQCDIRACKEKGSRHASEEKMGTDIDRLTADLETAQRAKEQPALATQPIDTERLAELHAEIAALRVRLEKAEGERDEARMRLAAVLDALNEVEDKAKAKEQGDG